jgi:hypothetical protein
VAADAGQGTSGGLGADDPFGPHDWSEEEPEPDWA